MENINDKVNMDTLVSLAKRRGFIFQGSEIYGGLGGTWDFGPYGVALKNNIKESWRKKFVHNREDMYEVDAAILMNPKVWESSGHVGGFSDPLVEDLKTQKRFRADTLLEDNGVNPTGMSLSDMSQAIKEKNLLSPDGNPLGEVRQFNMMFSTSIGAMEDSASVVYLRPETAQGMFVNYKNIIDSIHPKIPFGMAQIGKAFRNEITPRDYLFRVREFEQMEIEYFVKENEWQKYFEFFKDEMREWFEEVGIDGSRLVEIEKAPEDLAHYSKRTVDYEFHFPFGQKELSGLAYRTNFDLKVHQDGSKVTLEYFDEESKEKFLPHVIEPSFGLDRALLALLVSSYTEVPDKEGVRVYLKFKPSIAPVIACVSPLLKNKPKLVAKAREVFGTLKSQFGRIAWDDNGNIGKRYRRQDEIGTPWCIVVDFDSLQDDCVTVRDRDTGEQERVLMNDIVSYISSRIS